MRRPALLLMLLIAGNALAQQSPSFKLTEQTFNAGGLPQGGVVLTSASHRMTLGAIGDGVMGIESASASFGLGAGFISEYPPPSEVANLRFTNATTLTWDAERSVGAYNLYQGLITRPFDPNDGLCQTAGIPAATVTVSAVPVVGQALFYLVTAENRIAEEGSKGSDSAGSLRDNSVPCP